MKTSRVIFFLFPLLFVAACKNHGPQEIRETVASYVKGADLQDADALDALTHSEFRVVWNGPNPSDHTVFSREVYLEKFRIGEWGGDPRTIEIINCDLFSNYASVHVKLDGSYQDFESIYILVQDKNEWKVLQESVVVKPST